MIIEIHHEEENEGTLFELPGEPMVRQVYQVGTLPTPGWMKAAIEKQSIVCNVDCCHVWISHQYVVAHRNDYIILLDKDLTIESPEQNQ